MGLPRSTFYDVPAAHLDDSGIVGRMQAICDEFEAYGYRRVGAELRHQGIVVNHKKIRRLMRESDLQPRRRRRYVATTDSDHDSPIFPDRARDLVVDGPNQLWVADITYIAITAGFVYLAAILDAWSRRLVAMRSAARSTPGSRPPHSKLPSERAGRRVAACTIPTEDRNMPRRSTGSSSPIMSSSARWPGVAILTTMPKPRAS
jgi:HTH-like domain